MSYAQRITKTFTSTSTGGAADDATDEVLTGKVSWMKFTSAATTGYTLTVSAKETGRVILSEVVAASTAAVSFTRSPLEVVHTTTGGALLQSTTGGGAVGRQISVALERLRFQLSSVGVSQAVTATVVLD